MAAMACRLLCGAGMRTLLLVSCLVSGCGDSSSSPDAARLPDAATRCSAPTADAAHAAMHVLYVASEGLTLTKGSCDDATTSCTSLIARDQTVVPQFLAGVADRTTYRDQVLTTVRAQLAPYSIDVVTDRPASGDYDMIVLGGDATLFGAGAGVVGLSSPPGCVLQPRAIALAFDLGKIQPFLYADELLSFTGQFAGLALSTQTNDCMMQDQAPTAVCNFGAMAATKSGFDCGRTPTQDEPELLTSALGCR